MACVFRREPSLQLQNRPQIVFHDAHILDVGAGGDKWITLSDVHVTLGHAESVISVKFRQAFWSITK